MPRVATRAFALVLAATGCGRATAVDPGPDLQVLGESSRIRLGAPVPRSSPWFDGHTVTLVAARGETLGLQIVHRDRAAVDVTLPGVAVALYDVEVARVTRPSTALYGGSHGAGDYADGLVPTTLAPATNPAFVELAIPRDAAPGVVRGELAVGARVFPIELTIATITLPIEPARVWAYLDPRELLWRKGEPRREVDPRAASTEELACVAMFRSHGVLLSPDLLPTWWDERRDAYAGVRDLPVVIPDDPALVGDAVRAWISATRGTGHVPFAIPIDEPRTPARRAEVIALAKAVRAAGGGPQTFRFAVTDEPRPEYGDLVDLYIQLAPKADTGAWAYNGAPPRAGSVVADALTPGARTWGWIAFRYGIPVWYVWDALYWHDRHNRKGAPLPGRALDGGRDAVSFDDGEDHGNLDGVLALPDPSGCRPTLRLAALHRGQQDRQLLELAAACDPTKAAAIAKRMVPAALGDAPTTGAPAWPTDEAAWELARRELIDVATCGKRR